MAREKIYILDTNVLIHDPQALFSFEQAHVALPIITLQELDKFKGENTSRGRNCRQTIRYLDLLRERGSLAEGIKLDNGGTLQVLYIKADPRLLLPLDPHDPDNQILLTALSMKERGYDVHFISKDINMRVKAEVLGLKSFDYLKDTVEEEAFYKGWLNIQVPAVQLKKDIPDELISLTEEYTFTPNEFIIAESRHNPHNYKVFRFIKGKTFIPVLPPELRWPVTARNPQQLMALNLLLDPNVQLITLLGPAGTGKTFLALVAAIDELLIKHNYEKVLITRPVIPLGPDIGFLPGTIQEKLQSWMQPIYDNMDFLVHTAHQQQEQFIYRNQQEFTEEQYEHNHMRNKFRKHKFRDRNGLPTLDELIKKGKISLEAITYMRGRSIPYQYIIIDEVQNLTPHEIKTLISRVGEGSKIVLAGDPYQIDSPYLDFSSNGLVVASQKFKGQELFGTVFLEKSERSELSKLAAALL